MAYRIYIDQGHNPVNPNAGAEGNGLREQDIVYTIGREVASLLRSNNNFEVRLSRPEASTQLGDSNLGSLAARVDAANRWGADLFVSLHTNASSEASATGCEALVYSQPSAASRLGGYILEWITRLTGLRDRGVITRSGLYVLRKTRMPAVLLELGFITNPNDARLLSGEPELFAEAIYNGILSFYGLLKP